MVKTPVKGLLPLRVRKPPFKSKLPVPVMDPEKVPDSAPPVVSVAPPRLMLPPAEPLIAPTAWLKPLRSNVPPVNDRAGCPVALSALVMPARKTPPLTWTVSPSELLAARVSVPGPLLANVARMAPENGDVSVMLTSAFSTLISSAVPAICKEIGFAEVWEEPPYWSAPPDRVSDPEPRWAMSSTRRVPWLTVRLAVLFGLVRRSVPGP